MPAKGGRGTRDPVLRRLQTISQVSGAGTDREREMPQPKVTFKKTVLDLEVSDVEFTVGPEVFKAGHLRASLDVADLLRAPLVAEKTRLRLLDHGPRKLHVIKEIRNATDCSLKEAKDITENLPWTWVDVNAEKLGQELLDQGATVEWAEGIGRPVTVLDRLREILVEALDES